MSTTQERTATITLRMPALLKQQLEELAQAMGRPRAELALEAIRLYVGFETEQVAKILKGLRAAEAGEFATPEEVETLFNRFRPERAETTGGGEAD